MLGVAIGCSQVKPVSKQTQTAQALHLRFRRDTEIVIGVKSEQWSHNEIYFQFLHQFIHCDKIRYVFSSTLTSTHCLT